MEEIFRGWIVIKRGKKQRSLGKDDAPSHLIEGRSGPTLEALEYFSWLIRAKGNKEAQSFAFIRMKKAKRVFKGIRILKIDAHGCTARCIFKSEKTFDYRPENKVVYKG